MQYLTNEELKEIYFGAYSFEETADGYLKAYQYTKEQMEYFLFNEKFYDRCQRGSAKTLELITDATEISFEYILQNGGGETFEIALNKVIYDVKHLSDLPKEGKLTFAIPEGKKEVTIYLPADDRADIRNFSINSDYEPMKKAVKVLWIGDSITQGYGPYRSGETYVSVANRRLGYDVLNQGIGGYYYDEKSLVKMEGYYPDKIIIAQGTNQYKSEDREERVEKFYEQLNILYPNVPVLTITPVWRRDLEGESHEVFLDFCRKIAETAKKYPQVSVIDGFELMPHAADYYLPDGLHPNALGSHYYGNNLADRIEEIGF